MGLSAAAPGSAYTVLPSTTNTHDPTTKFTDVDNSEIMTRGRDAITECHQFDIRSPHEEGAASNDIVNILTTFFDRPMQSQTHAHECLLSKLTEMVNENHATTNGLVVCGFDTETGT